MISVKKAEWIKRLAAQGLSQRRISRATGVARETVRSIISRMPRPAPAEPSIYDVDDPIFTEPPRRCPGCGGFCHMPCLACSLRSAKIAPGSPSGVAKPR
ncbi:MAG: helix-turn-helix domain-containing protein [Planctomycetales bacterium]|nr:helix-turn-helix domain-containing protein [Planctomycetales bacterium]